MISPDHPKKAPRSGKKKPAAGAGGPGGSAPRLHPAYTAAHTATMTLCRSRAARSTTRADATRANEESATRTNATRAHAESATGREDTDDTSDSARHAKRGENDKAGASRAKNALSTPQPRHERNRICWPRRALAGRRSNRPQTGAKGRRRGANEQEYARQQSATEEQPARARIRPKG